MNALQGVASVADVPLIFDSAHALGSSYQGNLLGGNGRCEVFSLSATKPLPAGEGGLIATNDRRLSEDIKLMRNYGMDESYDLVMPGTNGKLNEFSAIVALRGLPFIDQAIADRNRFATFYRTGLGEIEGLSFQVVSEKNCSNYKDFAVLISEKEFGLGRDLLAKALAAENIETRAYFSPSLHKTTVGRELFPNLTLPVTELVSASVLCLPMHSRMRETDIEAICEAIRSIQSNAQAIKLRC